jgi:hypothetical protein
MVSFQLCHSRNNFTRIYYALLDMHPLAIEDLIHARKNARSKADYYPQHLFLRILCHSLAKGDTPAESPNSSVTRLPRSASPTPLSDDDDEDEISNWEQKGKDDDEEKTVYGTTTTARSTTLRNGPLRSAITRRLGSSHQDVEIPLPQHTKSPMFADQDSEVPSLNIGCSIQILKVPTEKGQGSAESEGYPRAEEG